jgi:hypothetical protein
MLFGNVDFGKIGATSMPTYLGFGKSAAISINQNPVPHLLKSSKSKKKLTLTNLSNFFFER